MTMEEVNEKEVKEGSSSSAASGIAGEVLNQLSDFAQKDRSMSGSDIGSLSKLMVDKSFGQLSEKERTEALKQAGNSLDAMVKGDIPFLKERLKELGVSTKELEEKEKQLSEKIEAAKPLEEAILKGDAKAMQKMLATMDPKQLTEVSELIQKHFDKAGMGLEVDYTDGKLIISRTNGDKAVAISQDKMDLIGVNKDGSYDFNRHFRHANPAGELKGYGDGALSNFLYQPNFKQFLNSEKGLLPDQLQNKLKDTIDFPPLQNIRHSDAIKK